MWTRVVSSFGDLLLDAIEAPVPTTPGSRFSFAGNLYQVEDTPARVERERIDDGSGEEIVAEVVIVTATALAPEPKVGPLLPAVPLKQRKGLSNGPAKPARSR